jgi:ubiquinone/menaquinone biosynthesis C-methylase UbiE
VEKQVDDSSFYDKIASGYDELYMAEQFSKISEIMQALGADIPKKTDKLLDVGCGTGISTSVWKSECVGIDPSKELIRIAQKNYPKRKFMVGRAESLPFPDQSFDVVISVTSIHNFEDIKKGIDEMKRVGKRLFIITALRKSAKIAEIEKLVILNFKINKIVVEEKDIIFICGPRQWKGTLKKQDASSSHQP